MSGYSFGPFWLDATSNEVYRGRRHVPLTRQPSKLLRLIVEKRSKPVTEDEIREVIWGSARNVQFAHNIAVMVSKVNRKLGEEIIKRSSEGAWYTGFPVLYRDDPDTPTLTVLPEVRAFLDDTRYGIVPIDEYLPIYPVYAGLRRDEIQAEYQGEYRPPSDFLTLMQHFPPQPPINQLYNFNGWKGDIPSEDELAGQKGQKLTFYLQGGTWHHVHTLTEIWKASRMTPPDPACLDFRKKYLKQLIPVSTFPLYKNVNTEVIVVTADDQIVIARRKGSVVFAGSWTASLEEQMLRSREKDGLSDNCDLFACAERGARSELGITVISEETRLLSIGLEFGNFTAAFLILIRSVEPFAEIAMKQWPNAPECDEAVALDALPARREAIKAALDADQYNPSPETCVVSPRWNSLSDPRTIGSWHPVAKARLDAYRRYLDILHSTSEP